MEADVLHLVRLLANQWLGARYDVLKQNCCHFSDRLCKCLGVGSIPAWLTSLADTGAVIAETGECLNQHRRACVEKLSRNAAGCCSTSCSSWSCTQALGCCSVSESTGGAYGEA